MDDNSASVRGPTAVARSKSPSQRAPFAKRVRKSSPTPSRLTSRPDDPEAHASTSATNPDLVGGAKGKILKLNLKVWLKFIYFNH